MICHRSLFVKTENFAVFSVEWNKVKRNEYYFKNNTVSLNNLTEENKMELVLIHFKTLHKIL